MKKLFNEALTKKLEEKWGFKKDTNQVNFSLTTPLETFESMEEFAKAYHPFYGLCTLGDVRYSVRNGEMVFDKCWRVPTEEFMDFSIRKEGKMSTRATEKHLIWRKFLTNNV